jgi:hypothetical protein
MRHGTLAAMAGGAVLAVALPPAAQAATVGANTPCVRAVPDRPTEPTWQAVTAGFTPNQIVTVRADDQVVATGQADAAGSFVAAIPAPALQSDTTYEQTFTLSATDAAGVAATPAELEVVRYGVAMPRRARPRDRVRYRAFGFERGERIYLHIRRNDRTLDRFSLGRAEGECGKATKRMRYMPLERYRTGTYEYWFTHSPRFSREALSFVLNITVFRRVRTSAATAATP